MAMTNEKAVEQLNSFLRGEISSVETYRKALAAVKTSQVRSELEQVEQNHQRRVEAIRQRITTLGGKPSEGSGVWGGFAKLVQSGADAMGEKAAVSALESGEDHGLADYRRDVEKLDVDVRQFVQADLLPQQEQTHGTLSRLKHMLN